MLLVAACADSACAKGLFATKIVWPRFSWWYCTLRHNECMSASMNPLTLIFRTIFKLVLLAAALVFALSLLFAGLVTLVFVLIKALLTGRKPAFVVAFQRFSQARQQFRRGGWEPGQASAGGAARSPEVADVVDVQAHEVRNDAALTHNPEVDRR